MKPEFRAWYKPDFDTPDGPLKFDQTLTTDGILFTHSWSDDGPYTDLAYPFDIPWLDDNWLLEQATDAYDINCKRIFEGDIIKSVYYSTVMGYYTSQVMRNYKGFYLRLVKRLTDWDTDIKLTNDYEVIGNIHQNKDLLQ